MFKHKERPPAPASAPSAGVKSIPSISEKIHSTSHSIPEVSKEVGANSLKELVEKNLKWSQIIYEQNRKINHKLLWMAIADWLRVLVLIAPIVLAILFLPPVFRQLKGKYGWLWTAVPAQKDTSSSIDNLLKRLPVNSIQREQLKSILKQ